MKNLEKLAIEQINDEAAQAENALLSNSEQFQDIGKTGSPTSKLFSYLRSIQRWADALLKKKDEV